MVYDTNLILDDEKIIQTLLWQFWCYGKANKPRIACKLLTQSLVQLLSVVCVNKLLLQ